MNVVGRVGSFISQGMYSVATPFHPFGGAVDIIVVKQHDGTFRSTPWYVRFGKFQGVLKGAEKVVRIEVNGVEAGFNMYLDNSGEAYFVREVDPGEDDGEGLKESENGEERINSSSSDYTDNEDRFKRNDNSNDSDSGRMFYEFQDEESFYDGSLEFSEYGSTRYDTLDSVEHALESQNSSSEVVLVSVDGHILTAPLSSSERDGKDVELDTPQFHLGPGGRTEEYDTGKDTWSPDYLSDLEASACRVNNGNMCEPNNGVLSSEHSLEPGEEHRELLVHSHADQKLTANGEDISIESLSRTTSTVLERDDVFKSCLELSELDMQSPNSHTDNSGSLVEIHEDIEDRNKNFNQSLPKNHETENGNHEILKVEGELCLHDSGSTICSSLPDKQVEASLHERNTLDMDYNDFNKASAQVDDNDQELQERSDVDLAVESKRSDVEDTASKYEHHEDQHAESRTQATTEEKRLDNFTRLEISLCGNMLQPGMGLNAAETAFDANRISSEDFQRAAASITKNEHLIVRLQGKYLPWSKAAHIVLGRVVFGLDLQIEPDDVIPVEQDSTEVRENASGLNSTPSRRWRLWPIPFRRVKTLEHTFSNSSTDAFVDSESGSESQPAATTPTASAAMESPRKQIIRTNVPTSDQIASLNLKEGQNMVNFVFCTRVLGSQKVEAHIYLWKWNTRIVVSDVDGTITKSDVLGQFMPLVGKDWTHTGIARLFSAIKENGYQLLFLSARAIVQAYLTKSFLFNLKQDGKSLPNGPVVISPDGLFPSLYREVIRRAPHEFKIACLEDIKALFPADYNPFYAGFGNRDTDELSYRKVGIPKGKIFIINPKGEVAINHRVDVKSYTSFHTLVNDMFPPTSLVEQEDYNSWNYWKMPLPDIDKL